MVGADETTELWQTFVDHHFCGREGTNLFFLSSLSYKRIYL